MTPLQGVGVKPRNSLPKGADIAWNGVLVEGDANFAENHVDTHTVHLLWAEVDQKEVGVGSTGDNLKGGREINAVRLPFLETQEQICPVYCD